MKKHNCWKGKQKLVFGLSATKVSPRNDELAKPEKIRRLEANAGNYSW